MRTYCMYYVIDITDAKMSVQVIQINMLYTRCLLEEVNFMM